MNSLLRTLGIAGRRGGKEVEPAVLKPGESARRFLEGLNAERILVRVAGEFINPYSVHNFHQQGFVHSKTGEGWYEHKVVHAFGKEKPIDPLRIREVYYAKGVGVSAPDSGGQVDIDLTTNSEWGVLADLVKTDLRESWQEYVSGLGRAEADVTLEEQVRFAFQQAS